MADTDLVACLESAIRFGTPLHGYFLQRLVEALDWIPVERRLPDDDLTVMIAMKDGDEPVWLGYYDGDCWYSIDATPIRKRVTHWKPMPEGPRG